MAIYALGDLHLSFKENKPMDIFGDNWKNHEEKISENWNNTIKDNDLVILSGDFSWAMHLKDTDEDFEYLNGLPGRKVMIKGNHDFWWSTLKSMNEFLEAHKIKNVEFIMNNAVEYNDTIIVGTRGWSLTESENSNKRLNRECLRLENSIQYALNNFGEGKEIICAMHYPPITKQMIEENKKSEYLEILKKYNIKICVYGHLHGRSHNEAVEGKIQGIQLKLTSCDYLDFKPYLIKI